MSKLIPLQGHIIMRPIEEEDNMYGNIALPNMNENYKLAEVIDTSDLYNHTTGDIVKCNLEIGDIVYVPSMGANIINLEGEELWVIPFSNIQVKLEK